ncbi:MAG: GTP cyclohydrolase I FolE [Bacteroidales bacterium]|nr:GTP cyclohydrolase I FolE [Bacteroidales bacterium]MBR6132111.1 GTP cyclohydrolase I FolE [Bacteroidales bacterium]MCR5551139.1 GTP cyclohydrolase I FolE [Bacteroidales bacterium]
MNRKKTIVDTSACTCNECNPNATTPLPVEQINRLADSYRDILLNMGEDPEREGLLKTPMRAAKAIDFLTHGYRQNPRAILESALFHEDYKQIVIVKDIEIYSLCEHHLLPFFGKAHIGYIPNGKIVGLSKIPRVVECFARRLQLQERLTTEIKDCLQDVLQPIGVAVVIEAQHLCMSMRGIQKQNSVTTTSEFTGAFLKNENTRQEFMHLIGAKLH